MIRIRRALIVLQVTTHAGIGGQVVVVVNVAVRTLTRWHSVHPGQGEIRQIVVKRCVGPRTRVVALGTGLRETRCHVVWVGSALIILQVAGYAIRARQVEVAVDVAVGTLARWNGMPAGKRETNGGVIEVRIEPGIHTVAEGAVAGEAARDMVRTSC